MTTAAPAATGSTPSASTPAYSWFVLLMLMFIYIFNFLDRQLMSTLQEFIKADLGLSDSQLGLMTGLLFAIFYTGFGVIVGFLADRTSRVRILAAGCFIWSMFTTLCGLAKSFPVMGVARVGVGVGEAAGAPPSYSIVSDYFPAERRGIRFRRTAGENDPAGVTAERRRQRTSSRLDGGAGRPALFMYRRGIAREIEGRG